MSGWSDEWTTIELKGCLPLKYMMELDNAIKERYWDAEPDDLPDAPTTGILPLKWMQDVYDFMFGYSGNSLRDTWYRHDTVTTLDKAPINNLWDTHSLRNELGVELLRPNAKRLLRPFLLDMYSVLNQLRWRQINPTETGSNGFRAENYGIIEDMNQRRYRRVVNVFSHGTWADMATKAQEVFNEQWYEYGETYFTNGSGYGWSYGVWVSSNYLNDRYYLDGDEDYNTSLCGQMKTVYNLSVPSGAPAYELNALRSGGSDGYTQDGASMNPMLWDKYMVDGHTATYQDILDWNSNYYYSRAYRLDQVFQSTSMPSSMDVRTPTDEDINEFENITPINVATGEYYPSDVFSFGTSMNFIAKHDVEGGFEYRDW